MLALRFWTTAVLLALALPAPAAQIGDDFYFDEAHPIPAAVLVLQNCDATERTPAHRKAFAGGFVFLFQCPSNNENFIETLVFSEHEDGSDGWLLKFPQWPLAGGALSDTVSNIRWFPKTNEIGNVFVDREGEGTCRFEARWKLEGNKREPRLVFWRENKDCDGKKPWQILLNRK